MEKNMKTSFVIPCYRSAKSLPVVVREICETMEKEERGDYEIILVNDASPDNTFAVICALCEEYPMIIGADLARNFGQHSALMAGMNLSHGDVIVCMDDDGQTPAGEVGKLLDKLNEGYDAVYARYDQKMHSRFRNIGSGINSLMTEKLLDKPKELYLSSYFAVKRFVVDEMLQYRNAFPFIDGLLLRTTDRICNVDVKHRRRMSGRSGYSLRKLLGLWINGFTAFSVKPLRFATYSGSMIALIGFLYALYTIIKKIVDPTVPAGWSSTMSVLLIIGGMVLLVLGLIGEYVGRIYICQNNSPQYVIRSMVRSNAKTGKNIGEEY